MGELAVAAVDVAPALEQLQDRPALKRGDGMQRGAARSVVVEAARASTAPSTRSNRAALVPASTRGGTPAVTPNALFPPTR